MKKILALSLILLFFYGCVQYSYEHLKYRPDGSLEEVIKVSGSKAMVNDSKGSVDVELPDGAKLNVDLIETVSDPNSAIAIGQAIGAGIKAATMP